MNHLDGIINHMIDVAPFEVHPRLIPYIKESMQLYADQAVKDALKRRDEEIKEWVESRNPMPCLKTELTDFQKGIIYWQKETIEFLSTLSPGSPSTSVEPSLPKEPFNNI